MYSTTGYSTTLIKILTSGGVVSETFIFFATRFLAGLRDFLGGAARLASRLAGGS
jgi:hypothetical protein